MIICIQGEYFDTKMFTYVYTDTVSLSSTVNSEGCDPVINLTSDSLNSPDRETIDKDLFWPTGSTWECEVAG